MNNALIIVNPIAGNKDKQTIIQRVQSRLDSRYCVEVRFTEYQGHAQEIVTSIKPNVVIVIGGDGTVNEVANAIVNSSIVMAVIPCGSGNGFFYHFSNHINIDNIIDAVNLERFIAVDCARVNGHLFCCTCGVGLDAQVGDCFSRLDERGPISYIKSAFLAYSSSKPHFTKVSIDGVDYSGEATMVTIGNANQWGNHAKITPNASVSDGELDVAFVKPFHFWEIPHLALLLMHGKLDLSSRVSYFRGKHIRVEMDGESISHYDGEIFRAYESLNIDVLPSALNVVVPQN